MNFIDTADVYEAGISEKAGTGKFTQNPTFEEGDRQNFNRNGEAFDLLLPIGALKQAMNRIYEKYVKPKVH
jgi:hypothetical protein